jgi:hypothetical protein
MDRRIVQRARDGLLRVAVRLRSESGQGTVEYVALILLIATVMTAVVLTKGLNASGIASTIVNKLKSSIDNVGSSH